MDVCIDLFYILLSRILFAIPEKKSPLIFLVAALKDSPPPGCRAFFHIAINLFLINNLHLQKTVATFRSSVFAEPAFCGYSPIFFSRTELFEPANRIFCKPRGYASAPHRFVVASPFGDCPLPSEYSAFSSVTFRRPQLCGVPCCFAKVSLPPHPTPARQLALSTLPPRELLPRNRPGKALLGGCCSI